MTDVLILAVLYNTYEETLRFLKSIEAQKCQSVKIILVDNSNVNPATPFMEEVEKLAVNATYIKSEKNLGYFGGAKHGLEFYLKNNVLPQWIIVSNVDIIFNQPYFFKELIVSTYPENVGVIAPSIVSNKWETDTNPKIISRYSKRQMNFYRMVCANVFTQNFYMTLSYVKKIVSKLLSSSTQIPGEKHVNEGKIIYAPHGSCIIFKKNYFERGGNLNHISFLFGEEIFVAETAIRLKLKVYYEPQLLVTDFEHASTGFFYSKKISDYMKQSTTDIIRHYYSEA